MKIIQILIVLVIIILFSGCKENKTVDTPKNDYLDFSKREDPATGWIKMIPITTPIGKFNMIIRNIIFGV
jgi:proline iminopeptidase